MARRNGHPGPEASLTSAHMDPSLWPQQAVERNEAGVKGNVVSPEAGSGQHTPPPPEGRADGEQTGAPLTQDQTPPWGRVAHAKAEASFLGSRAHRWGRWAWPLLLTFTALPWHCQHRRDHPSRPRCGGKERKGGKDRETRTKGSGVLALGRHRRRWGWEAGAGTGGAPEPTRRSVVRSGSMCSCPQQRGNRRRKYGALP